MRMNLRKELSDSESEINNTPEKKKSKVKKCYNRKMRKAWLEDERFSSWIDVSEANKNKAFCKVCNREVSGGVTQMERHANTDKHIKKCSGTSSSRQSKGTQEIQISINPGDQPYFGTESTEDKVDVPCILHEEPICIKTKPSNTEDTLAQAVRSLQEIAQKNDNSSPKTDEFDTFGVSVAGHLRQLPVDVALESQSEIFQYLVQRRLGHTSNL